jgi:acyl-CoA thioester hydrolase
MSIPVTALAHSDGIVPVLTETTISYKKPFFLNNTVTVEVWISKLQNASAIMSFRFLNEKNEICAVAQQKGLFINRKTMRPTRLSPKNREAFERFLIE